MKAFAAVAIAACIAASAFAAAPLSLAGKVYRESAGVPSLRASWEKTILFSDSSNYVYLKNAAGSTLDQVNHSKVLLGAPPADGTYVYTRTNDTSATALLIGSDGVHQTIIMTFTSDSGGTTGETSFYLRDLTSTVPVSNVSLRGRVAPDQPLIAGFTIPGTLIPTLDAFAPDPSTNQREVLIRVVGPGLAKFGLTGFWADPLFQIYEGTSPAFLTAVVYNDWTVPPESKTSSDTTETAFRKIFSAVGAFPLASGSKDAAAIVRLNPGSYTVVCTAGAGDVGGDVLIEVYVLP